ncbi:MAG TPA: cation diffusion facilitator family transporter [Bryobacteraceae bacterium]|nr:cation diffusion facilitator family transporter [Bryobacteraceae bacterium]
MKTAVVVTLVLVAIEFVAGTIAHSLALVSDAWHNLTDVPSLVLAALAIFWEHRPPDHQKTFGYQRAGVLAAFVNSLVMIGVAVFLCYKGYARVMAPEPIATGAMFWVGMLALLVNGAITVGLAGDRRDLNMRAVFIHNLGDALSSIGIVAGAWLITKTGQPILDPLIAFLIAGMILWSAVGIVIESANILLESLPKGMSLENVATAMLGVPGVCEVHDVHVWSLGSQSRALSCHVRILDMPTSESEIICRLLNEVVSRQFGITHTTIQFEHTHAPGDFHRYMPEPAAKRNR